MTGQGLADQRIRFRTPLTTWGPDTMMQADFVKRASRNKMSIRPVRSCKPLRFTRSNRAGRTCAERWW